MPPLSPRTRPAPIDLSPDEFRRLGHRLVDRIADHFKQLPAGAVTPGERPPDVRAALGTETGLPDAGTDAGALLDETADRLFAHSLFNGHPRFLGYITSSAAPIGILGDLLATAINANVGAWTLSPAATEIESQTVRWIAELLGFPPDGGGLLVSGGNMANLVCVLAARTARAPWEVRRTGVAGSDTRLRIYASSETHTWIQKAADLCGLGTDVIRWLPVDPQRRLDLEALQRAMADDAADGALPWLVVGTAGSVSTGSVDDLPRIAEICARHEAWFHVDGAYGAVAAQVPGGPPELAGLSQADSVAVDPHKWLYAPLEAGCALVRDPDALRATFAYHPPYYHFEDDATNYVDQGPQNSRGFRALKVWLILRHVGRRGCLGMIADDIALARDLFDCLADHPTIEALTHGLSITTFRYVPLDLRSALETDRVRDYLNRLNRALLGELERGGEFFLSNAVIDETFALRACIVNFRTTRADVQALPGLVDRLGTSVDERLRETLR